MSKNKNKKGKKGMTQNHARSAEETRAEIKKLLGEGRTPRQICDDLQLGYSTVMKYRKSILLELEQPTKTETTKPKKPKEEIIDKTTITFRVKNYTFEVEVIEKNKNTLYCLNDLKNGLSDYVAVDLDNYVRKTIEKGREFIHDGFLLPIANKVKDFYFTKSVQYVLFVPTEREKILSVVDLFGSLLDFVTSSSTTDWENVNSLQEKLLKSLDEATDIQELTSITSRLKKVRARANDISDEEALREYISSKLDSKSVNLMEINEEIKSRFL